MLCRCRRCRCRCRSDPGFWVIEVPLDVRSAGLKSNSAEGNSNKKKKRRGLAGWLTSVSGILASVATIVAAGTSVLAAHQTSRVNQLTIVVRQQNQQLKQAHQQAGGGSGASGTGGTSGSTGGALAPGGVYLSAKQSTVNNAYLATGPQTISAQNYPSSNTFYCYGQQGNG